MKTYKIGLIFILLLSSCTIKSEQQSASQETYDIKVYRSPNCGCCGKWVQHLKDNQFNTEEVLTDDLAEIKKKYKVPLAMGSCHTAIINGYVIEGHVPANDIKRLLKSGLNVVGISVPGMPVGTPGMEVGNRSDEYQVMSFDDEGRFQEFNRYEAK